MQQLEKKFQSLTSIFVNRVMKIEPNKKEAIDESPKPSEEAAKSTK